VIVSRVANALIEDVQVVSAVNVFGGPILGWYRRRYGGLWVGGRLTVTDTEIQFHANAVNRSIQSGQLDFVVKLRDIASVELSSRRIHQDHRHAHRRSDGQGPLLPGGQGRPEDPRSGVDRTIAGES